MSSFQFLFYFIFFQRHRMKKFDSNRYFHDLMFFVVAALVAYFQQTIDLIERLTITLNILAHDTIYLKFW